MNDQWQNFVQVPFLLLIIHRSSLIVCSTMTFQIGTADFLLNNKPILIRCGEMHFARIPREYWQHRLRMARAMGLNAVCAYLYWNRHEPRPGEFRFDGWNDVAAFCSIAQQEGLLVILRPGPYSCAEWDLGGFPWWLLKTPDIKLRTRDPRYTAACRRYLLEVGKQLSPLQITRGGPIIMVQVENEYGSYGNDRQYIGMLRDNLLEAGFDVPLFTCDGPVQLKNDVREDIFCVVNFGGDPAGAFKALREIRPTGPLMCGEFYPGWFDSWGRAHHVGAIDSVIKDLQYMLEQNASFSIYMAHGGTSFGFSAGANSPPFSPQSTSYDYDAPMNEAGNTTPKFFALRELFEKHLSPGETLPPVPPVNPAMSVPQIELKESAELWKNLGPAIADRHPQCMEMYDVPHGCVLYRTQIPAGDAATLKIIQLHDYGLIFLDGKKIATLDRRHKQNSCELPARSSNATLDILIEAMGHVNYGIHIHDRKGITERVELNGIELLNWKIYPLPLDDRQLDSLKFELSRPTGPAFYRGSFDLTENADTYLDMTRWGKGVVWINGHNLGRFWSIGPQQTLYLPGPWLQKGRNEIIVFEIDGTENPIVAGLDKPILNAVGIDHHRPVKNICFEDSQLIFAGEFTAGPDWKEIKFPPKTGRYFCLQSLSSHSDDTFASIAELDLLDSSGKELPRNGWQAIYADSEELQAVDGAAGNVLTGIPTTFWHTQYQAAQPNHPHLIVLDLGSQTTVHGLRYLPRSDRDFGRIKKFQLYLSITPYQGL
jgi:beta-galactosidase